LIKDLYLIHSNEWISIDSAMPKQEQSTKGFTLKRGRKAQPLSVSAGTAVQLPPLQQPKIDPEPLPLHRSNLLSDWLKAARRRPDERYQLDLFTIAWEEDEFKMKCIECAKIYAVRLHQSLSNFETHLKNRTNRGFVDRRLSGGV